MLQILFDDELPLETCSKCGELVAIVTTYPGYLEFRVLKADFRAGNTKNFHGHLTAEMDQNLIHRCRPQPKKQEERLFA